MNLVTIRPQVRESHPDGFIYKDIKIYRTITKDLKWHIQNTVDIHDLEFMKNVRMIFCTLPLNIVMIWFEHILEFSTVFVQRTEEPQCSQIVSNCHQIFEVTPPGSQALHKTDFEISCNKHCEIFLLV